MLATTGSGEIAEWIAELGVLRPEDEAAAVKAAREEQGMR